MAHNVFYDNRGFPDESYNYDHLLHNINDGVILRRKKFSTPPLDVDDPTFNCAYSKKLHGESSGPNLMFPTFPKKMCLPSSALSRNIGDERGIFTPVCYYECVIDTGNATPIAIKKILYGPREIPIMRKSITALEKVGQIHQIHDYQWL